MGYLVVAVLGALLVGTLTGWVGHWGLHQKQLGPLAEAHQTHHRLYPPGDYISKTYRSAGKADSLFVLGPLVGVAIGLYLGALYWLGFPWYAFAAVLVVSILVGVAHEWFHRAFHLEGHWMLRYWWFQRLRMLHFHHHVSDGVNLGIIWFGWDRLFGTFQK